jgi:hypothetical protein
MSGRSNDEAPVIVSDVDAVAVECEPSDVASSSMVVVASAFDNDGGVSSSDTSIPLAVSKPLDKTFPSEKQEGVKHQPIYISATVLRNETSRNRDNDIGISFERVEERLRISSIDPEGLFGETPINEGDFVLSVNHACCADKKPRYVSRLIRQAKEAVTLVVRRKDGDPYIVSTMVTKPTPESKVGIGLQCVDGSLCVSTIDASGLFASGILNVGDTVVSIGGVPCPCMDSTSAIELIRKERRVVTIVTWTEKEAGVVVATRTKSDPGSVPSLIWSRRRDIMIVLVTFTIIAIIAVIVSQTGHKTACEDLGQRPLPVERKCP